MVGFRKRFGEEGVQRLAEAIALASLKKSEPETKTKNTSDETDDSEPPANQGQLIADATCAPADIRYPTDVSLLNEAREKTDTIIDQLHIPLIGKTPRPRTCRLKARRAFVAFTKHKKPGRKKVRRAKRQQLGFLRRNFKAIDRLLENSAALPLDELARRDYKNLLVARELFRQQLEMFENKSQRVDDRIVSISQPHVRPIVRGKAGRPTEFGAKLSISVVQGFSFVDRLS
jgi:IS5 family transposase